MAGKAKAHSLLTATSQLRHPCGAAQVLHLDGAKPHGHLIIKPKLDIYTILLKAHHCV